MEHQNYFSDPRSAEEISHQSRIVEKLSDNNINRYNIRLNELPPKSQKTSLLEVFQTMKATEIASVKLNTMHFDGDLEGAHCSYQIYIPKTVKYAYPVLTTSGFPSYLHEWTYLAENSQTVWINFLQPGFETVEKIEKDKEVEGLDERRGKNYEGTILQTVKMIAELLDKLGYEKIILGSHSFGIWIFLAFEIYYPERVVAAMQLGTFGITWHKFGIHMFTTFSEVITELGFENIQKMLNGSDEERAQILEKIYNKSEYFNTVLKPLGVHTNILAVFKVLFSSEKGITSLSEFCEKKGGTFLNLLVGGTEDTITNKSLLEQSYYNYYGNGSHLISVKFNCTQSVTSEIKLENEKDRNFLQEYVRDEFTEGEGELDLQNLQSNFIFLFEKTGHSVHHIRGEELISPLRVFFKTVQGLELIKQRNNNAAML